MFDGETKLITTEDLERLFVHGDALTANTILSGLPKAVAARSQAHEFLQSDVPARRLLGVSRVLLDLAYAVDPEKAMAVWEAFAGLISNEFLARLGISSDLTSIVARSGFAAAAHASLQRGQFDIALCLCDEASLWRRENAADEFEAWLQNVRFEALIRTHRIAEALEIRRQRLDLERSPTDRQEELDEMLDAFVPSHPESIMLDPAKAFSWIGQTTEMLSRWIETQSKADKGLETSYAELPLAEEERRIVDQHFRAANSTRNAIAAVLGTSGSTAERDDVIHRALFRHQEIMRSLQGPSSGRPRTLHDNRHVLNRAAMTLGLHGPGREELAAATLDAQSAADWSAGVGDRYGELMALWTLGLIADRLEQDQEAIAAFKSVFAVLEAMRDMLPKGSARGLLSGTFRTLIPRLVALTYADDDIETAFRALEFQRGLAIVDADRTTSGPSIDPPTGVHYLSASVFETGDVFVALRTADGGLSMDRISFQPERLNVLASRADPGEWHHPFTRRYRSPRTELGGLVRLLEEAFADSRINEGDHVAMALDHPLHTTPVHYLDLDGHPAVHRLTFSRIASWQDLRRIVAGPVRRPENAAAIFVMTSDTKDIERHRDEFEAAAAPLMQIFGDLPTLKGELAVRTSVLSTLAAYQVVHVYAHGVFPHARPAAVVDPMRNAGLLVATEKGLPTRSEPDAGLLCGMDILDGPAITACHVSLSACVSGLGRPGVGHDMLGLEFALRLRGVESVLASHWHVTAAATARFFAQFYWEWLGCGRSRGEAWRRAILSQAGTNDLEALCAACAFSLYGDWR